MSKEWEDLAAEIRDLKATLRIQQALLDAARKERDQAQSALKLADALLNRERGL